MTPANPRPLAQTRVATQADRFRPGIPCLVASLVMCSCAGATLRPFASAAVESPVVSYGTELPAGPGVTGQYGHEAIKTLVESAGRGVALPLKGDPRLAALALAAAGDLQASGALPSGARMGFVAEGLGLVDLSPELHLLVAASVSELSRRLRAELPALLVGQQFTHYGAHVCSHGGRPTILLVLSERSLELQPVARQLSKGAPIPVRGEQLGGLRNPGVEVLGPDGAARSWPAGGGPRFDVRVPTPQPGPYTLSVTAQRSGGRVTLARLRVYVGSALPVVPPAVVDLGELALAGLPDQFLAWANRQRATAGLGPLALHGQLAAMASRHSQEMSVQGYIGHSPAATGSPQDRYRRTGLGDGLILENIVRASGVDQVGSQVLAHAGHRANLLHPDVTHLGVGTVVDGGTGTALLVTLVYAALAPQIDEQGAARELLGQINAARRLRGSAALSPDARLMELAARTALAFFAAGQPTERELVELANSEAERYTLVYRRVSAVMAVTQELHEVSALEPTLEAGASAVGIGVAQGDRSDTGPRSIAVVFVLGYLR